MDAVSMQKLALDSSRDSVSDDSEKSSVEVSIEEDDDKELDDVELQKTGMLRKAGTEKIDDFDPWALPELEHTGLHWSELDTCGRVKRVLLEYLLKLILLLGLLYMFICSLGFLSDAFRLLGGKAAGEAFSSNKLLNNPVSGLMIGILSTVLVQSSSTSTSIVVAMVASEILQVRPAIPIIMGANIGTSVTNTLVSLAQASERNEFRRAFAGAVIHDVFNWLSVAILLPIEVATGYLYKLTDVLIHSLDLKGGNKAFKKDLLKTITKPFTSLVIQLDKKIITKIALGDKEAEEESMIKYWCDKGQKMIVSTNVTINGTQQLENVTKTVYSEPCKFLFHDTGMTDTQVGIILLALALFILCTCLVSIVKVLHSLLKGQLAHVIKKTINADFPKPFHHLTGYLAILVGACMTILVQSSSIFTSALTPLVGIGVVSLERTYPLTLGSNIGTTFTAILASLASDGSKLYLSLQIALCHLFFNLSGICLWYVVPATRKVPVSTAKKLGNITAKYRWFAVVYMLVVFFLLPALFFGLSLAGWQIMIATVGPFILLLLFVIIVTVLQKKAPQALPSILQDWDWAPKCTKSLEPYDKVFSKISEVTPRLNLCSTKRNGRQRTLSGCPEAANV